MEKNLYIDASHPNGIRIVLKSSKHIEEYEYEDKNKPLIKNNIYLGKVSRVEPSLQAAFVNFGRERHGFLAFGDIQSEYYQIPHDDKEKLKKEEEEIREELKEQTKKNEENSLENNNGEELREEIRDYSENHQKKDDIENIKQKYPIKRYRIQEVIKPGQILLIQILKDERGQKGAALTTFVSLAGKYTVLMPNTPKGGGISRKITKSEDRKKIRNILQQIEIPKTMGLIVRTAGSNKTRNEINKDLDNTLKVWEEIKNKAMDSIAPCLIYEEGDIIKRSIRDIYDSDTKNIIVEGNEAYQKTKKFMKMLVPENTKFVKKYRGKIPLFHSEGIEKDLNRIFEPIINLESGGYLVINPTEALISIDINSGKSTKQINVERTALTTNLEAADEIARQIKIRDLAGLIIIDFIDMLNYHNRRIVERRLKERLKEDRAKIQFNRISNFGLLEMSRQRLKESSIKWDMVLSLDSFSFKILKVVEELAFSNTAKIINAFIPEKVKENIIQHFKDDLSYFNKKHNFIVNLISEKNLIIPEYKIELLNKNKKIIKVVDNTQKIQSKIKFDRNNKDIYKMSKKNRYQKNRKFKKKGKKFNFKKESKKQNLTEKNLSSN